MAPGARFHGGRPRLTQFKAILSAPGSELGRALARELARTEPPARPSRTILVNLLWQPPNTLLHDGHAWERHAPGKLLRETRRLLEGQDAGRADLVVHASYAFLRAAEGGARLGDRITPIVEAALEAERLVAEGPIPAIVVRLGYLYGPGSRDLELYRAAFRVGRPYWAGPSRSLHDHLHLADAAAALALAAARPRGTRQPVYATDGRPASFQAFMDHFARLVGNPLPLHIPGLARIGARLVVGEAHMQAVALGVHGEAAPVLSGFEPRFPGYRSGLADVVATWRAEAR